MGATVRPREFDADQPSQTEQLANWISRVRSKKIMCRKNRKRNLRIEAVLSSVLYKAEQELRNKQLSRIMRWQQMRQRLIEDMGYKDGNYKTRTYKDSDLKNNLDESIQNKYDGIYKDDEDKVNCYDQIYTQEHYNTWAGQLCPELSSLDSFMSQLSEIKAPFQR
ncbi:PREDICTED: uncharacterized protein LOC105368102 [Ceratosolen solmsi marchali]|uniref:Uncharacterized protein LOC105368102 n=1 Tax=Ceratosolen solmsi marchali TaxID=326594 RepID=A0AAJ7E2D7_9HYME|nr:PREDICTED: uncharacterized protein LOC105368102 [Ceratosolen solmsi marchali]